MEPTDFIHDSLTLQPGVCSPGPVTHKGTAVISFSSPLEHRLLPRSGKPIFAEENQIITARFVDCIKHEASAEGLFI